MIPWPAESPPPTEFAVQRDLAGLSALWGGELLRIAANGGSETRVRPPHTQSGDQVKVHGLDHESCQLLDREFLRQPGLLFDPGSCWLTVASNPLNRPRLESRLRSCPAILQRCLRYKPPRAGDQSLELGHDAVHRSGTPLRQLDLCQRIRPQSSVAMQPIAEDSNGLSYRRYSPAIDSWWQELDAAATVAVDAKRSTGGSR